MQVSFWSNMHGQAATSATTAAVASYIAQNTAYKSLVAHNHIERSALEGYFFRQNHQAGRDVPGLANQGVDALVRLMKNGRLKPEMVADYTYSLLRNHRLDILLGTSKKDRPALEDEGTLLKILECARSFYDLVLLDIHSGLNDASSRLILETSDAVVFCLNQNRFLLEDFTAIYEAYPFLKGKRAAFAVSRYEKQGGMTLGNISRQFRIDRRSLFCIPGNSRFADALNNGRVFEFVSFYQGAGEGDEKEFIKSIGRLSEFVVEGCASWCRSL